MEVILKEDVANLGHRGDVVKVADGYGRNFLLPRKLALQATLANKAVIEQMKEAAARRSPLRKYRRRNSLPSSNPSPSASPASQAKTASCSAPLPPPTLPANSLPRALKWIAARFSSMNRSRAWATSPSPSSCTARSPLTSGSTSRPMRLRKFPSPSPRPQSLTDNTALLTSRLPTQTGGGRVSSRSPSAHKS